MSKAIYVEWDDSSSMASTVWKLKDDVKKNNKPCRCKTVGFVIAETVDSVTLASSLDGGDYVSGDMQIPKSAIRKRRVVRWK